MQSPGSVAFSIFGIEIMWYGVLIAAAMGIAVLISCNRAPVHGMTSDKIINFCLVCIPAGVIGARLYFVIFNLSYYSQNWFQIFNTRGGGLAIQGGLIFAFITAVILCRFWNERPLNILDLVVPAVALAQSIGRWGNFFNSEAHGGPTDLPWAVIVDGVKVHPTFLYESLWCLILFFVLIFIDNRRKFEGQTFLIYCILYSAERFIVEGFRTDSLMLFELFKQAQVLSVLVIAVAVTIYIIIDRRIGKSGFLSTDGKNTKVNSNNIESK